jgi:hypothetical protein
MSPAPDVTLPLPDPLALLDATALFVIQLLIARHPELLAGPDEPTSRTPLGHVSLLLDAVRELQYALEVYRACLPVVPLGDDPDHDIPF